MASSGLEKTQQICQLNLTRKQLTPPKFELTLPSEITVALNERGVFPVEYTGEEVDVKWFFNTEKLGSDFQVKTIAGERSNSTTAIISQMKQSLDGELTCQLS